MTFITRTFITLIMLLLPAMAGAAEIRYERYSPGGSDSEIPVFYVDGNGPYTLSGRTDSWYYDTGFWGGSYRGGDVSPIPASELERLSDRQRAQLAARCDNSDLPGWDARADCRGTYGISAEDDNATYDQEAERLQYNDAGGYALKLFRYAMGGGDGTGNDCITCTFLGNFMLGMADFSAATFFYLQGAFKVIIPLLIAIWIGYRTSRLFVTGGEDGRSYIYGVAGKTALFFLLWIFVSTGESATHFAGREYTSPPPAWEFTGPTYLSFAFGLSSEIRDATLDRRSNVTNFSPSAQSDAFRCSNTVEYMSQFTDRSSLARFSGAALDVACATERSHMVGFASGLAIISSAQSQLGFTIKSFGTALIKLVSGFFLIFIFGLSAIWFTFLVLDVVVRGLITAAFLPAIAGAALFNPSRYIAFSAIKSLAGAVVTAISIGIISTLALFLLTNTVHIYNSLVPQMQVIYENIDLQPITASTTISAFEQFIVRIQESNQDRPQIPMDLSTPWFYYLVLSGLAIFSLGKKIIAMLEGMIGIQGSSAMANNAMKLSRTAMGLGMGAGATAAAATAFASRAGLAGAAWAGGSSSDFIKNTVSPFGANAAALGGGQSGAAAAFVNTVQGGADPAPD